MDVRGETDSSNRKPNIGDFQLIAIPRVRIWRNNQSWMCLIVGAVGTGKSWCGLSLCDAIMGGKFDINKHLFFKVEDFIIAIKEKKLKRGDCVLLDEIGISFSNRESMTKKNRALSAMFQIMRYKNLGVVMTVPMQKLLDVVGRDMINAIFETRFIKRNEGYCMCKVKFSQQNAFLGKVYHKYPRPTSNGVKVMYDSVQIFKPRKELTVKYEKKKREYAESESGLFEQIADMLNGNTLEKKDKGEINAYCLKCGWEWHTNSKKIKPTCPSCRNTNTTTTKSDDALS